MVIQCSVIDMYYMTPISDWKVHTIGAAVIVGILSILLALFLVLPSKICKWTIRYFWHVIIIIQFNFYYLNPLNIRTVLKENNYIFIIYYKECMSSLRSLSPCTCVEVFEWYG